MTDQPELLESVTDELLAHGEFSSGANNRANAKIAAQVVIKMVMATRPTPAERPVAQVREMRWLEHAKSTQCCDPIIDGLIGGAIEIISALTARPSDAAVAWRTLAIKALKASEAYARHTHNACGWWNDPYAWHLIEKVIKPVLALPPDEPAPVIDKGK